MFGKIEKLMTERGITAYQVSKDTGIAQSSLSDWKVGKSKPGVENLLILARYFGVPMEFFLQKETK